MEAYLRAIVKAAIGDEFKVKEISALPPESALMCSPNLVPDFYTGDTYSPS